MRYTLLVTGMALALAPVAATGQPAAAVGPQVRVHAHILLVDRTEATRVGLGYVQVGGGLVGVRGSRIGGGIGAGGEVAGVGVAAFVELARDRGLLRSETRAQVLALSGAAAAISTGSATVGRRGATRVRGPELAVTPTLLEDGRVLLEVRARIRDEITGVWGWGVDASPLDVATTVAVRPGEDATVGSMRVETHRSDAGLLRWEGVAEGLDILVVLRAEVVGD